MIPFHTFTRRELTDALESAGRPDLAEQIYATRPEDRYAAPRALALDYSAPGDLATFAIVAARLMPPRWAVEFGRATTTGLPAQPDGRHHMGAHWPGFVLDEPTPEEWWDTVNACSDCEAAEGTCTSHEHAPWEATPILAGV